MQTDNVGEQRSGGTATRIANQYGVWKPTLSKIKVAAIYGKSEKISEKLAYRKFIKDSEFETSKVFLRSSIFSCSNTSLVSNSESLINL